MTVMNITKDGSKMYWATLEQKFIEQCLDFFMNM